MPASPTIILTADRTLMADYPTLMDGMMATIQTTAVPGLLMRRMLSPPVAHEGGLARRAPLGLRRIEAALRADGFAADEIAVVRPEAVERFVGAETRVIGLASGDPLGEGMSNTTMLALCGGRLYTEKWYADLCARLRTLKDRWPALRVLAGGAGAWQLAGDIESARELGIDVVLVGYAEAAAGAVIRRLAAGESVEPVVRAASCAAGDVPCVLGPTVMGVVEISRGCGWGCGFCTIAAEPMRHLSVDHIVADARTNLAAGAPHLALISEDLLRYGAAGRQADPDALLLMLEAVRALPGAGMIQVDHVNVVSALQYSPAQLRAVYQSLTRTTRHRKVWVNVGIESAAGDLLEANDLAGKMRPYRADDWADACAEALRRLKEAGFVPMVSLVMGLPGETPAHVEQTLRFMDALGRDDVMIFPIFFAPVAAGQKAFTPADMTDAHWRLFRRAYGVNFRTVPQVFWDNHRAAGVPLWRRAFVQVAGRGQKWQWRWRFVRKSGRWRA